MSNMIETSNMSSCDICGKEVSKIVLHQQSRPSAKKWADYGLCSVGCAEPVRFIKNSGELKKLSISREEFYDVSLLQIQRLDLQDYGIGIRKLKHSKLHRKTLKTCERIILIGKVLAIVSLIIGLSFFYYEFFIGALISLIFILSGIIVCRLGVWEKCRIR